MNDKRHPFEVYCLELGYLVQNLITLEGLARYFNARCENVNFSEINTYGEGQSVACNAFTNYDSLGEVLRKYNTLVTQHLGARMALQRDVKDICAIRDTLAHGRVWSIDPPGPDTVRILMKFSKPINGNVQVTHKIELSTDYLKCKQKEVHRLITKVRTAIEQLEAISAS